MNTTSKNKSIMTAVLAIAVGMLTASPLALSAAEIAPSKGGATKLLELSGGRVTAKSAPSEFTPMKCANCQDVWTTVRDTDAKGFGAKALLAGAPPTKAVTKHLCHDCRTEWVVKGQGKAKTLVANHKCASCG